MQLTNRTAETALAVERAGTAQAPRTAETARAAGGPVTATYWMDHAWLGTHVEPDVTVEVAGGRIAGIRTGVQTPPAGATVLRGLTLPGLANTHSHAFHRALRATVQVGTGTFWTWRELMYQVASRLTPDSYFDLARATYAEMALAGITAVGEFHYLHHAPGGTPYADPNAMGRPSSRRRPRRASGSPCWTPPTSRPASVSRPTGTSSASPTPPPTPGPSAPPSSRAVTTP